MLNLNKFLFKPTDYVLSLRKLSADEQFSIGAQMVLSL